MKTIRRLYLYGITFVSLEVIIWGTIGLLRGLFFPNPQRLRGAFACVGIGDRGYAGLSDPLDMGQAYCRTRY